ncbi:Hypothetical predicted protein [Mytilus galloprovincialis]|nr:Hypothetical predicted protein [Mytilus galloprovincialis]
MDTCHQLVTRNPEASIIINGQNCKYVTGISSSSTTVVHTPKTKVKQTSSMSSLSGIPEPMTTQSILSTIRSEESEEQYHEYTWMYSTVSLIIDGGISLNTLHLIGTRYLKLNERQTKTRTGDNIADVREVAPKMYEYPGNLNLLALYDLYASKRPSEYSAPDSPFYIAPRTIPLDDKKSDKWYIRQKRLTNHSARKYLV